LKNYAEDKKKDCASHELRMGGFLQAGDLQCGAAHNIHLQACLTALKCKI